MTTIFESKNAKTTESAKASEENVENTSTQNINTTDLTETEFTRATVESMGSRVRITDSDEASGLELFCYLRCGPDDDDLIRRCRGIVFHGNTIVLNAFPYTVEYEHTNTKQIKENIQAVFNDCHFYDSHEGALIRMFYFSGRWFTTTHRKLNAFRSKWSSKESFGTSFKRSLEFEVENNKILRDSIPESGDGLLERFQTTLDQTKQYMFLVLHNEENRIVCSAPVNPTLFHVGTFVNGDLVMNEDINIPHPRKHTFTNMDALIDHVSKTDINSLQGIILFAPDNKQYKILHKDYFDLFQARGNEPSIKYRYLQVRMNIQMVNMLYHLYPDMSDSFDEYENIIYSIAKSIYHSYVQRFIKKKWVTVAGEEFNVIRECHAWHEEDRKTNRISINRVIDILNTQTPTNLNKMIRRFKCEKDNPTTQKVQPRTRANTVSSDNQDSEVLSPHSQHSLLLSNSKICDNPQFLHLG